MKYLKETQSLSAPATCQPNIKQNIECHNKSTLQARMNINESHKLCNNRKPSDSPMNGPRWMACVRKPIVYQATVTTEGSKPDETYVRLTWNTFKTRSAKHKNSFNNPTKRMSTELNKHVWSLKQSCPILPHCYGPYVLHKPSLLLTVRMLSTYRACISLLLEGTMRYSSFDPYGTKTYGACISLLHQGTMRYGLFDPYSP